MLGILKYNLEKWRSVAQLTIATLVLLFATAISANAVPTSSNSLPDSDDPAFVPTTSAELFFAVVRNAGHSAWANLYAYGDGDPVNRSDPSGLDWIEYKEDGKVIWKPEDGSTPWTIGSWFDSGGSRNVAVSGELGGGTVNGEALSSYAKDVFLNLDTNASSISTLGNAMNFMVRNEVINFIAADPGQLYRLSYQGHYPWEGAWSVDRKDGWQQLWALTDKYSYGGQAPADLRFVVEGRARSFIDDVIANQISSDSWGTLIGGIGDAATAFAATGQARSTRGNSPFSSNPTTITLLLRGNVPPPSTQLVPQGPLLLPAPGPRTVTRDDILSARGRVAGTRGETLAEEMFMGAGRQTRNQTKAGLRINDVASPPIGTRIYLVESKAYRNEVPWSKEIQQQIWKDVLLRRGNRDLNPIWYFWNAPPSAGLARSLRTANIPYVTFPNPAQPPESP